MEGAAMTSALVIYQRALDAVSAAVLAGDFGAYMARIDLPYLICTLQASFVLHRPAELEPTFRSTHGALAANGATHYERLARDAVFARRDRIEGWHFTHIIAKGDRVVAPWAARQAIVLRDGHWRFSEAHYPFQTDRLPFTEQVLHQAMRPGLVPGEGSSCCRADAGPSAPSHPPVPEVRP